ncbi:MAG: DUF2066 domain-containing protein [Magnetococcales bacterium]|nr:DUF2066 domain-containing protein [Magnetococcales bacterium]
MGLDWHVRLAKGYGFILAVWALLATPVWAEPNHFYQVGAEAVVPLPLPAGQEPRSIGLEKAKKMALERLFSRMFTRADLEREKGFFNSLLQGGKRFSERVQIVGETQRGNALHILVEVTFSAKGIAAALAEKGMAYNESRHPPVLVLVRAQGGAEGEAAAVEALLQKSLLEEGKAFAMPMVMPLGDLEDMAQLSWERAKAADPALKQWVAGRYGTDQLWTLAVQLGSTAAGKGKSGTPSLQAQLSGVGGSQEAIVASVAAKEGATRCSESGETGKCPASQLVRELLQQVTDRWIQAHTINPALQHVAQLRVIHGPKLAQFSQFTNKLRSSAGVVGLKFVEERATEATLQIEYQGQDNQLQELLTQLGAKVEPLPAAAVAPSNRIELLLQLP